MEEPWSNHGQTMEEVPLKPISILLNFMLGYCDASERGKLEYIGLRVRIESNDNN
jgi:hypothetical protein